MTGKSAPLSVFRDQRRADGPRSLRGRRQTTAGRLDRMAPTSSQGFIDAVGNVEIDGYRAVMAGRGREIEAGFVFASGNATVGSFRQRRCGPPATRWKPTAAPQCGPPAAPRWKPTAAPQCGPTTAPQCGPPTAPQWKPTAAPRCGPPTAPQWKPTAAPQWKPTQHAGVGLRQRHSGSLRQATVRATAAPQVRIYFSATVRAYGNATVRALQQRHGVDLLPG